MHKCILRSAAAAAAAQLEVLPLDTGINGDAINPTSICSSNSDFRINRLSVCKDLSITQPRYPFASLLLAVIIYVAFKGSKASFSHRSPPGESLDASALGIGTARNEHADQQSHYLDFTHTHTHKQTGAQSIHNLQLNHLVGPDNTLLETELLITAGATSHESWKLDSVLCRCSYS